MTGFIKKLKQRMRHHQHGKGAVEYETDGTGRPGHIWHPAMRGRDCIDNPDPAVFERDPTSRGKRHGRFGGLAGHGSRGRHGCGFIGRDGETFALQGAARIDAGFCGLCDKNCPLDAPGCGKGAARAARMKGGGQ